MHLERLRNTWPLFREAKRKTLHYSLALHMGNKRKKWLFLSEGYCQIHQPGGLEGGKWKGGDLVGEWGAKQGVVCAYDTR